MTVLSSDTLIEATVNALERTAMVLAEPANDADNHEPVTAYARIAYSGPSSGTLTLAATDGFLCELASSLLGVEPDEVAAGEQGLDALKEMANILGGSIIVAMYFVIGVTGVAAWSLRTAGVPVVRFLTAVLRPWGLLTTLALAVILVDQLVTNGLTRSALASDTPTGDGTIRAIQRLLFSGIVYCLAAAALARVVLPDTLRSILAIAPNRIATPLGKLLRLRAAETEQPE